MLCAHHASRLTNITINGSVRFVYSTEGNLILSYLIYLIFPSVTDTHHSNSTYFHSMVTIIITLFSLLYIYHTYS